MYGRRRLDVTSARAEADRLLARVGFDGQPRRSRRPAHLLRSQAHRTRPGARMCTRSAAARRMAGRAQPHRTGGRHRAGALAARRGTDHRHGGARDARHPLAVRPHRGAQRRPRHRRRHARRGAGRSRRGAGVSGGVGRNRRTAVCAVDGTGPDNGAIRLRYCTPTHAPPPLSPPALGCPRLPVRPAGCLCWTSGRRKP